MKLPVSLGIKPALITAAVLLAVIAGMGIQLALVSSDRDVAKANLGARTTERDAWKLRAEEVKAANGAYETILQQIQDADTERQRVAQATALRAAELVKGAKADSDKAQRDYEAFQRRYAAKPPTCAAALQAMQAACPTLEGY